MVLYSLDTFELLERKMDCGMRYPFEASGEAFAAGIHLKNEKLIEMLGVHVIQVMKSREPKKERQKVENMEKSSADRVERRRRRVKSLQQHLDRARTIIKECSATWNVPFNAYMLRRRFERSKTEKRVANLLLKGYGELRQEVDAICKEHVAYERVLAENVEIRQKVADLDIFFAHLERETNGQVKIERLMRDTDQYERCKKAVKGHVRGEHSRVGGESGPLEVCNIFKVKHAPLLSAFKKRLYRLGKDAKTKGLFCTISEESLENMFSFGMQGSEMSKAEDRGNLFKGSWFEQRFAGDGQRSSQSYPTETHAEMRAVRSSVVTFPRIFSRFSSFRTSESKRRIVYLVLCRVILTKPFALSKSVRKFPTITEEMRAAFDVIYAPGMEEYLLLDSRNVFPEFVFQCKWAVDSKGASVESVSRETADLEKNTLSALRDIANVYADREEVVRKDLERSVELAGRPLVFSRLLRRRKTLDDMRQHSKANATAPTKASRDERPSSRFRKTHGRGTKRAS